MTDELQELEPIEEPAAPPPITDAPPAAAPPPPSAQAPRPAMSPGLAAPAYNPSADKEYYRFLFAGIVIFIGCLMPFGPDWNMAGYKTPSGAVSMLVAIGMIWSWWGAIANGRFRGANLKWVFFALLPLLLQVLSLIGAFDQPAVRDAINRGLAMPEGLGGFFGDWFNLKDVEAQERADNFLRAYGSGKLVILVGCILAELFLLMAVFGGAKHAKAQKAQQKAQSSSKGSRPASGGGGGRSRRK